MFHFLPPYKDNKIPRKMAMMKISASFPHGMYATVSVNAKWQSSREYSLNFKMFVCDDGRVGTGRIPTGHFPLGHYPQDRFPQDTTPLG